MRAQTGDVTIEVDDDLGGYIAEVIAAAIETIRQPIADATREVATKAMEQWPERTGRTRMELGWTVETTPAVIRGVIWSDTEYAYKERFGQYLRKKSGDARYPGEKIGKDPREGQHIWTTLVRKPLEEKEAEVVKRIATRWRALTGR